MIRFSVENFHRKGSNKLTYSTKKQIREADLKLRSEPSSLKDTLFVFGFFPVQTVQNKSHSVKTLLEIGSLFSVEVITF